MRYFPPGIHFYCGDHRYGRLGETLDYPLAYPLVAQIITEENRWTQENVDVTFKVIEGTAKFPNGGTQYTAQSQWKNNVGNVNTNDSTFDAVYGAAVKCPVTFGSNQCDTGTVKIEVTAVDVPDPDTFTLKCVGNGEEDDKLATKSGWDDLDFHEPIGTIGDNSAYPGDGLWGCWVPDPNDHPEDTVWLDKDHEDVKNLWLEIDYMSDLGEKGDMQLEADDIRHIYQLVADIFAPVGIEFGPLYDLDEKDVMGDPVHEIWEPGSVMQKMDKDPNWLTSPERLKIGHKPYVNELGHILMYSRGKVGIDDPPMGRVERSRIHIVLIPGTLSGCPAYGATKIISSDLSSERASGQSETFDPNVPSPPFPWVSDTARSEEIAIDSVGICILTDEFEWIDRSERLEGEDRGDPSKWKDTVSWNWKCEDVKNGTDKYNPYCYMLAAVIAHEIGHAIGLMHHDFDELELMYPYFDFCKKEDYWNEGMFCSRTLMVEIEGYKRNLGFMINLRKVLGREVVNIYW